MKKGNKIACVNNAGFVMNFSIQWLGTDGVWVTTEWNSGNYPINQTRVSPTLTSIGVPTDALAIKPYVHAILGKHNSGNPLVQVDPEGQTLTYDVKGTTLDFSVNLID